MPTVVGFDNSVKKKYTCKECGAINEVTPNEIKVLWSGTDYSGNSDGAKGFHCGNCGEKIITESW